MLVKSETSLWKNFLLKIECNNPPCFSLISYYSIWIFLLSSHENFTFETHYTCCEFSFTAGVELSRFL